MRDGRLRVVDVAASAGISTQQVRNYLAAGVLPPADHTPSGCWVLTGRHRRALAVWRRAGPP